MNGKDMFNTMQKATQAAFDRVISVTGQENDPDLQIYQSLKPEDFGALVEKYGSDGVIGYIQKMESRSLMKRTGG
jgi:hypothetical protein